MKLENVLTGNLLVNSLRPLLVGHWSVNSEASEQAFNLEGKSAPGQRPKGTDRGVDRQIQLPWAVGVGCLKFKW